MPSTSPRRELLTLRWIAHPDVRDRYRSAPGDGLAAEALRPRHVTVRLQNRTGPVTAVS